MTDTIAIVGACLCYVAAAVSAVFAIIRKRHDRQFRRQMEEWVRAEASFVEYHEERCFREVPKVRHGLHELPITHTMPHMMPTETEIKEEVRLVPVMRYKTTDGTVVTAEYPVVKSCTVGKMYSICYNPNCPKEFCFSGQEDELVKHKSSVGLWLLIGLTFLAGGLAISIFVTLRNG